MRINLRTIYVELRLKLMLVYKIPEQALWAEKWIGRITIRNMHIKSKERKKGMENRE